MNFYPKNQANIFRLRLLDGNVSKLIVMPQWIDLTPSLSVLDYARHWAKVWRDSSPYNIYITRPELVTNMIFEFSVIDEETFTVVGEHSIHKIESVEHLNSILDSYLSNINL